MPIITSLSTRFLAHPREVKWNLFCKLQFRFSMIRIIRCVILLSNMLFYLCKKGMTLLLSLWCVVTGTFLLMHAMPGDPFIGEQNVPQEVIDSLYAYYGLDQPLWVQYGKYLKELLSGNLGFSIVYQGRSVNQFIQEGLPISAQLGLQALLVAVPSGILL